MLCCQPLMSITSPYPAPSWNNSYGHQQTVHPHAQRDHSGPRANWASLEKHKPSLSGGHQTARCHNRHRPASDFLWGFFSLRAELRCALNREPWPSAWMTSNPHCHPTVPPVPHKGDSSGTLRQAVVLQTPTAI